MQIRTIPFFSFSETSFIFIETFSSFSAARRIQVAISFLYLINFIIGKSTYIALTSSSSIICDFLFPSKWKKVFFTKKFISYAIS